MPLFIVGHARSGTTLCQSLVSRHLVLPTLPETHFFERLRQHEPAAGVLKADAARALLESLQPFLPLQLPAFDELLAGPTVPVRRLFLALIGQVIGSQTLADQGLWIEKTPGHLDSLERIHAMFPDARFLWMVREPAQVFASHRELLEPGKGWGDEWKPVEAHCAHWLALHRRGEAFAERHPDRILQLRLEDMAADPEAAMARVRAFVGSEFAATVPSGGPQADIIQPFEVWKRDALKPADPAIAQRAGRQGLSAWETWRVQQLLGPQMQALGYATDAPAPPMDPLHHELMAGLDWYRQAFEQRDQLMDVKTTRIRSLLKELGREDAPARARKAAAAAGQAQPAAKRKAKPKPAPPSFTLDD